MFDYGELRLVVLAMIAEEPRHGYELMRAIEERLCHGLPLVGAAGGAVGAAGAAVVDGVAVVAGALRFITCMSCR